MDYQNMDIIYGLSHIFMLGIANFATFALQDWGDFSWGGWISRDSVGELLPLRKPQT